jgi:hypothetical protein
VGTAAPDSCPNRSRALVVVRPVMVLLAVMFVRVAPPLPDAAEPLLDAARPPGSASGPPSRISAGPAPPGRRRDCPAGPAPGARRGGANTYSMQVGIAGIVRLGDRAKRRPQSCGAAQFALRNGGAGSVGQRSSHCETAAAVLWGGAVRTAKRGRGYCGAAQLIAGIEGLGVGGAPAPGRRERGPRGRGQCHQR